MDNDCFKIQLELNSSKTAFEPYVVPQIIKSDSTGKVSGIISTAPFMTLVPDAPNVMMKCTYNADTKKYIDNKISELISQ